MQPLYRHTLRLAFAADGPERYRVDASTGTSTAHTWLTRADLDSANAPVHLFARKNHADVAAAAAYGARLFAAVMRDEVRRLYAGVAGQGVRLAFDLTQAPALAGEVWELLFDPERDTFLALHPRTPIVREISSVRDAPLAAVDGPLVVGVVIASPRGRALADADGQWECVRGAFEEFGPARVRVFRIAPTLAALREFLSGGVCHVLHFAGHGEVNRVYPQGALVFETDDGAPHHVDAQTFATVLDCALPSLRLVFLSACDGAQSAIQDDPYAGVAQRAVQQGVPAVVAMQHPITEQAADTLAGEFHKSLAAGRHPEAALANARIAVKVEQVHGLEWATPVLYLRSAEDTLFPQPQDEAVPEKRPIPPRGFVRVSAAPHVEDFLAITSSTVSVVTPAHYAQLPPDVAGAVPHAFAEIVVRRNRLMLYVHAGDTLTSLEVRGGDAVPVGPFTVSIRGL